MKLPLTDRALITQGTPVELQALKEIATVTKPDQSKARKRWDAANPDYEGLLSASPQ